MHHVLWFETVLILLFTEREREPFLSGVHWILQSVGGGEGGWIHTIIKSSLGGGFRPGVCLLSSWHRKLQTGLILRAEAGCKAGSSARRCCRGRREKRQKRTHRHTHCQAEGSLFFHTHIHSLSHIWDQVCTDRRGSFWERAERWGKGWVRVFFGLLSPPSQSGLFPQPCRGRRVHWKLNDSQKHVQTSLLHLHFSPLQPWVLLLFLICMCKDKIPRHVSWPDSFTLLIAMTLFGDSDLFSWLCGECDGGLFFIGRSRLF